MHGFGGAVQVEAAVLHDGFTSDMRKYDLRIAGNQLLPGQRSLPPLRFSEPIQAVPRTTYCRTSATLVPCSSSPNLRVRAYGRRASRRQERLLSTRLTFH